MMRMSLLVGVCAAALAAGPVWAADLPLKAPPAPPPIQPYNWSGFYLGANIGGAWSHSTITDEVTGASLSANNSGFIGGGQAGFNYQANNWLFGANWIFGVEGDIDGTTISKTSNPV